MTVVGDRLRKLRGERSMQEVADAVGVKRSAINMYEIGQRVPRDKIKIRLADYYKTDVKSLFYDL